MGFTSVRKGTKEQGIYGLSEPVEAQDLQI